jgi:hypothetical protein
MCRGRVKMIEKTERRFAFIHGDDGIDYYVPRSAVGSLRRTRSS